MLRLIGLDSHSVSRMSSEREVGRGAALIETRLMAKQQSPGAELSNPVGKGNCQRVRIGRQYLVTAVEFTNTAVDKMLLAAVFMIMKR